MFAQLASYAAHTCAQNNPTILGLGTIVRASSPDDIPDGWAVVTGRVSADQCAMLIAERGSRRVAGVCATDSWSQNLPAQGSSETWRR